MFILKAQSFGRRQINTWLEIQRMGHKSREMFITKTSNQESTNCMRTHWTSVQTEKRINQQRWTHLLTNMQLLSQKSELANPPHLHVTVFIKSVYFPQVLKPSAIEWHRKLEQTVWILLQEPLHKHCTACLTLTLLQVTDAACGGRQSGLWFRTGALSWTGLRDTGAASSLLQGTSCRQVQSSQ